MTKPLHLQRTVKMCARTATSAATTTSSTSNGTPVVTPKGPSEQVPEDTLNRRSAASGGAGSRPRLEAPAVGRG